MFTLFTWVVLLLASASKGPAASAAESAPPAWPLPMQVPVEHTVFTSDGRTYELYLRNWGNEPLAIERIDVLDEKAPRQTPVMTLDNGSLNTALKRIGDQIMGDEIPVADDNSRRTINAGSSLVVYLWISIEPGVQVSARLRHRVTLTDATVEGASIGTHHAALRVLGLPVSGAGWVAGSGPRSRQTHTLVVDLKGLHAVSQFFPRDFPRQIRWLPRALCGLPWTSSRSEWSRAIDGDRDE